MSDAATFWKRCSSCKKEIGFSTAYWVCSVSTCTRKRTGMVFCSVTCWEVHLPMMRHREAYAVEERSPSRAKWAEENAAATAAEARPSSAPASAVSARADASSSPAPHATAPARDAGAVVKRRVVATPEPESPAEAEATLPEPDDDDLPQDVLVVVSKLKKYIRERSGMNTSDTVMPLLSDHLRELCKVAIRNAAKDGRRTVLDRDIPSL